MGATQRPRAPPIRPPPDAACRRQRRSRASRTRRSADSRRPRTHPLKNALSAATARTRHDLRAASAFAKQKWAPRLVSGRRQRISRHAPGSRGRRESKRRLLPMGPHALLSLTPFRLTRAMLLPPRYRLPSPRITLSVGLAFGEVSRDCFGAFLGCRLWGSSVEGHWGGGDKKRA